MTDPHSPIRVERRGAVAHIVLDRAGALNAIDLGMARLLLRSVIELNADPECAVIVVEASGRTFCTGGDVSAILGAERPEHYLRDLATTAAEAFRLLSTSRAVVVCAIDGISAGAGVAFALAADIVVATPAAVFISAYANVGLVPDCGVTMNLPAMIGRRRALDFVLSGRAVKAAEALDWQLVTEVVPRADLHDRIRQRSLALAAQPPLVAAAAKRLLRTDPLDLRERIVEETDTLVELLADPHSRSLLEAEYERQHKRATAQVRA